MSEGNAGNFRNLLLPMAQPGEGAQAGGDDRRIDSSSLAGGIGRSRILPVILARQLGQLEKRQRRNPFARSLVPEHALFGVDTSGRTAAAADRPDDLVPLLDQLLPDAAAYLTVYPHPPGP